MYIYQNGKLYVEKNNKLIGIDVSIDSIVLVDCSETTKLESYSVLTFSEVIAKFNIKNGNSYIFPRPTVAEVVEVEEVIGEEKYVTTDDVQKPTRKSTRK